MSTMSLVEGSNGVVAAWETEGQIYFSTISSGTSTISKSSAVPGPRRGRKHPVIAINKLGQMIIAWTEGTGWEKGGALCWQVYDSAGRPTSDQGRIEGAIPVWGLPAVVATETGFTIYH